MNGYQLVQRMAQGKVYVVQSSQIRFLVSTYRLLTIQMFQNFATKQIIDSDDEEKIPAILSSPLINRLTNIFDILNNDE